MWSRKSRLPFLWSHRLLIFGITLIATQAVATSPSPDELLSKYAKPIKYSELNRYGLGRIAKVLPDLFPEVKHPQVYVNWLGPDLDIMPRRVFLIRGNLANGQAVFELGLVRIYTSEKSKWVQPERLIGGAWFPIKLYPLVGSHFEAQTDEFRHPQKQDHWSAAFLALDYTDRNEREWNRISQILKEMK
jgi:hypothetical protein